VKGLHRSIEGLAVDFAAAIVAALRSATFADIVELQGGSAPPPRSTPAREPGAAPKAAKGEPPTFDLAEVERRTILAALEAAANNRSKAAQLLGIPRSTLYNKLASGAVAAPPRRPRS
jgi:DNA-binding NtrC family response regulator